MITITLPLRFVVWECPCCFSNRMSLERESQFFTPPISQTSSLWRYLSSACFWCSLSKSRTWARRRSERTKPSCIIWKIDRFWIFESQTITFLRGSISIRPRTTSGWLAGERSRRINGLFSVLFVTFFLMGFSFTFLFLYCSVTLAYDAEKDLQSVYSQQDYTHFFDVVYYCLEWLCRTDSNLHIPSMLVYWVLRKCLQNVIYIVY